MKKILALFIAIMASASMIQGEVHNGTCGDNLSWTLDTEIGILTITGTGEMTNYKFESNIAPWWQIDYSSSIKQIVIEEGITRIGNSAFQGCAKLTSATITIPNSAVTIGEQAFYGCNLTQIILPHSLENIESKAFYGSSLTSIEIPSSVITIGEQAFGNCSRIESITIDALNPNYKDVDGVLYIKDGTTLIKYPEGRTTDTYFIPEGTKYIGNNAFDGNSKNLVSVTIPNSVITIGDDAFSSCSKLASIIIPNSVTYIGAYAFAWCSGLTSIVIPNSVQTIGERAFFSCKNLTTVTIGSGVANIGDQAFIWCAGLASITSKAITPPSLGGNNVFLNIDKSIPLYVPEESVDVYKATTVWKDFENIVAIPDPEAEEEDVNVNYLNKTGGVIDSEQVTLTLPVTPEIEGFTFLKWVIVANDLTDGINIQAVYTANIPTEAPAEVVNPANPTQKLVRDGNVYILTGDKTYTVTGQEVK